MVEQPAGCSSAGEEKAQTAGSQRRSWSTPSLRDIAKGSLRETALEKRSGELVAEVIATVGDIPKDLPRDGSPEIPTESSPPRRKQTGKARRTLSLDIDTSMTNDPKETSTPKAIKTGRRKAQFAAPNDMRPDLRLKIPDASVTLTNSQASGSTTPKRTPRENTPRRNTATKRGKPSYDSDTDINATAVSSEFQPSVSKRRTREINGRSEKIDVESPGINRQDTGYVTQPSNVSTTSSSLSLGPLRPQESIKSIDSLTTIAQSPRVLNITPDTPATTLLSPSGSLLPASVAHTPTIETTALVRRDSAITRKLSPEGDMSADVARQLFPDNRSCSSSTASSHESQIAAMPRGNAISTGLVPVNNSRLSPYTLESSDNALFGYPAGTGSQAESTASTTASPAILHTGCSQGFGAMGLGDTQRSTSLSSPRIAISTIRTLFEDSVDDMDVTGDMIDTYGDQQEAFGDIFSAPGSCPLKEYKYVRPLGNGATCNVYEASNPYDPTERHCALKRIENPRGPGPNFSEEDQIKRQNVSQARNEINILAQVSNFNKHIIGLEKYEQNDEAHHYIGLELCQFSFEELLATQCKVRQYHNVAYDTLDHLPPVGEGIQNRIGLPMDNVIAYTAELLKVLVTLHENNIVHRDVKPANLLLTYNYESRLADFGVAEILKPKHDHNDTGLDLPAYETGCHERLTNMVGTLNYCSPEMWLTKHLDLAEQLPEKPSSSKKSSTRADDFDEASRIRNLLRDYGLLDAYTGYDTKADIWAMGCLVAMLASGMAPWTHLEASGNQFLYTECMIYDYARQTKSATFERAKDNLPEYVREDKPDGVSHYKPLLYFLEKCLTHNPEKRASAYQLMTDPIIHEWLMLDVSSSSGETTPVSSVHSSQNSVLQFEVGSSSTQP